MSDQALTRTLRSMVALGFALGLAGFIAQVVVGGTALILRSGDLIGFSAVLVFVWVVWVAAGSQPRNALIWVLAVFILSISTTPGAEAVVSARAPGLGLPLQTSLVPAELPPLVALTTGWSYAVTALGFFGLLTFGLLLFPDGRLPSRRWRLIATPLAIGIVFLSVSQVVSWLPQQSVAPEDNPLFGLTVPVVALGPPACLAGLLMRFRQSGPETRARIKWILWGSTVMVPTTLAGIATGFEWLFLAGLLALTAGYGIAIVRHRLLDVDLVISRTFVYGSLALFIGVVYVGVVIVVGSLVGSRDEPNALLSVAATALVAVAFQPVRRRLERVANRLVFGRKATPYEVLSEFSHRVAATSDVSFDEAARSLAEGTRAERVVISIRVDGAEIEAAAWPEAHSGAATDAVSLPIEDSGAALGSLDLYLPPGQQLQEDDHRLAEQVASGMGLALRNQLLTERLEARVEELRESRRRLVAVQDETRRRLERDLHDGAQQQLVALKVNLGLSRTIAEEDGAQQTAALLGELSGEADETIEAMRDFARGVYPPLLEAEGLSSAISAHARQAPIPVTVDSDGLRRYSRQVESTIYFCVIEALDNVARYAAASRATVALRQANGTVAFTVHDDGYGFDPVALANGDGLTNIEDRLDASGGALTLTAAPGQGTTITGTVPVVALEEASS